MPTYSYSCRDCGTAFDIHQAFTDDALTVCPTCGGSLRKVFGAVGVTFNGSGFYRTDSRGKSAASDSGKSSGSGSSSGSAGSDSGGSGGSTSGGSTGSAPSAPSTSASSSSSSSSASSSS